MALAEAISICLRGENNAIMPASPGCDDRRPSSSWSYPFARGRNWSNERERVRESNAFLIAVSELAWWVGMNQELKGKRKKKEVDGRDLGL